ncbi:uncharacterized protein K444DRAFT_629622 [Hyaloscypha bicolor E]|uniref:Uncharacterized protein n=1 Tax=Hyaloscypha bicolor E TaxID=1095630 RepID=A0A2J6TB29_9HELO|nr:uncharacterized protein K444DRAFT_629622 [Hyaloscypha bicolor E]PMD60221.1 hypothetical protein K444DRAFT_629622 [Hyaloscypha bicolor E]
MLAVVSRRAGVLEQEGRAVHDLQAELDMVRAAAESQRQKAERVEWLEGELAEAENKALLQQGKAAVTELTAELATVKADAEILQKEAERVHGLETELNDLRTVLQAIGKAQEELEKTRQDLGDLRQLSGSYIKKLKLAKADAEKRLEASKSRVTGLEEDLEVARQSIKERETELLEREKKKLEAEQKEIQAAVAEAKASSSQDLGELMQQEAHVDASLS